MEISPSPTYLPTCTLSAQVIDTSNYYNCSIPSYYLLCTYFKHYSYKTHVFSFPPR